MTLGRSELSVKSTTSNGYKHFFSWRLITFFSFVTLAAAGGIVFVSIALSYRNWVAALSSVAALAVFFGATALLLRLFGLGRIRSFESDGASWIRVYGGGSDLKITRQDVLVLGRRGPYLTVETTKGNFELSPDCSGYSILRGLLESWDPAQSA